MMKNINLKELLHYVKIVAALKVPDDHLDDVPVVGVDGEYITCGDVRFARELLEIYYGR